ncbi:MAG: hypothetical protein KGJ78_06955 [Alphaproteobacteria bacterium]|nr:hypothetical protein [Alphaproteobacteria bacterium]
MGKADTNIVLPQLERIQRGRSASGAALANRDSAKRARCNVDLWQRIGAIAVHWFRSGSAPATESMRYLALVVTC